jgi:hypothetical protein
LHIGNHECDVARVELLERFAGIAGGQRADTGSFQRVGERFAQSTVVLDDQDRFLGTVHLSFLCR